MRPLFLAHVAERACNRCAALTGFFTSNPKAAVMEKPEASTLDPPEVLVTGGGDEGQVPVETAAGRTNQVTVWEMMSG